MPRGLLGQVIVGYLISPTSVLFSNLPAQTLYDSSFCVSNKYRCAMLADRPRFHFNT